MKIVVAIMAFVVLSVVAVTVFGLNKQKVEMDAEREVEQTEVLPFSEEAFNDAHADDIRACPVCEKKWQGLLCLDGYKFGECVGCGILRDSAQMLFDATNAAAEEELQRNNE